MNDTATITCSVKTLRRIYEALNAGYTSALWEYAQAKDSKPVAIFECTDEELAASQARAIKYYKDKMEEISACSRLACKLLREAEMQTDRYPSFPLVH